MDKKRLDNAASKLLDVLDRHASELSPSEREAKWAALAEVVANVETRAKRREPPKTEATPRPGRKQA